MTRVEPTATYACFNFRLRSPFALPELPPEASEHAELPTVDVRRSALPAQLPGAAVTADGLQVGDQAVMFSVPQVARFLVRAGREILVDPADGATELNLRLFLLGSALGLLCFQRGLLPLHASAVLVRGAAVAFAGESGAGKSTLAMHLARRGYPLLCDDVCMIDYTQSEPIAWPGPARLKLWREAAETFGLAHDDLEPVADGVAKYQVPIRHMAPPRPVPFRRLYLLERSAAGRLPVMSPIRGPAALAALIANTYRGAYVGPMGLRGQQFAQCATLLNHADVYSAPRAWGLDVLEREAARLEHHFASVHYPREAIAMDPIAMRQDA